jgi:hypothetical protein
MADFSFYRGFTLSLLSDGWWATAGSGLIRLGPFTTSTRAQRAVDHELGD